MKKLLFAIGVVALATSTPASARWWDGGIWSGDRGCSTKMPDTNRWYYLLLC